MRLIQITALFLLMFVLFVSSVSADAPLGDSKPYLYAMSRCSGLSPADLVLAQQDFDTAYGWQYSLTTPEQWTNSYQARANEFAHSLGCDAVFDSDGNYTLQYRIYVPTFKHIYEKVLHRELE